MPRSKAANKRHQQEHRDRAKARRQASAELNTLFHAAVIPDSVQVVDGSGPGKLRVHVEYDKAGYEAFEAKCAEVDIDAATLAQSLIQLHSLQAQMNRTQRRALVN